MKSLLTFCISLVFCFTSCQSQTPSNMKKIDKTTVSSFDINRYLGTWYELARYPHRFERDLQGVTATYSLMSDGKIKVLNQGYKGSIDGEKSTAVGKAKLNTKGGPGKLKVSFFWIFYADYYVMELDPDYQWALVGSKSDNYLWVLSRKPKVPEELLQSILERAKKRGYDLSTLQIVEQK